MFMPIVFHGKVGGTREAGVLGLGRDSLSGSPSSVMMWRRSFWGCLVGRAGEDGGVRDLFSVVTWGWCLKTLQMPKLQESENPLLPVKKTLFLPLNIKAFIVNFYQSDGGSADCRGRRLQQIIGVHTTDARAESYCY